MKKIILVLAAMIGSLSASCQDFGLSFSYFLPRNGYFSTPISPFSFRGLGVNLNRFIALETGASLYRMSGLNVTGTPMKTRDALVGPNFTIFVPGEVVLQFINKRGEFDLKAGGFFFYGFDQKLNYGNLDRAIRALEGWDVANSSFDFKNSPGFGYHFGAELTVNINKQFGVSLETNYLIGSSKLPLTGSYSGGLLSGTNQTKSVDFSEAKVDFTGLEFSIGVIMKSGRR